MYVRSRSHPRSHQVAFSKVPLFVALQFSGDRRPLNCPAARTVVQFFPIQIAVGVI
jgi:hypothetical protein